MSYRGMSEDDWSVAGELVDRLEQNDRPEPKHEPEVRDRQAERIERDIQRERDDKRKSQEHRERTIKALAEQSQQKQAAKEYYRAPPLKDPDASLRDQIRSSIDFHALPPGEQQQYAANVRSMEEIQKAAVGLGLKKPETAAEIARINELMNGQAANQAAIDPYVQATIDHVVEPLERQAQQLGTDSGTLVQHFLAAENAIRQDPMWAGSEILRQGGETRIGEYIEMAHRSGTSLSDAVGRYIAAEQLLERAPAEGIAWLADNYQVSEEQVIRAIRQRRWG
jgi:hypothetical protein